MAHTYKTDLEEYIFTRPEMAKLLGISTNALRMRMKKGRCTLDYRFDGKKFLFKRPRDIKVHRPPLDPLRTPMRKPLGTMTEKYKRDITGGVPIENMGENQVVRETIPNKVSNTIMN
jgi:hypothetical protein